MALFRSLSSATTRCLLPLQLRSQPLSHQFLGSSRKLHTSAPILGAMRTAKTQASVRRRIVRTIKKNYLRRVKRRKELEALGPVKPFVLPQGPILHWQPPRIEQDIVNFSLQSVGKIELPHDIFGQPIREDIVHRVVEWQRANRRQGTHKTKTRAEVKMSGRKVRPQKGQGRARMSTRQAPQFVGGGRAHGKKPRSHGTSLPRKIRALGLKVALSAKQQEGNLVIIDKAEFWSHKQADLLKELDKWDLHRAILIHGDGELDPNLALAAKNLPYFHFLPPIGANVYDIVKTTTLIVTVEGLQGLIERLKPKSRIKFPGLVDAPTPNPTTEASANEGSSVSAPASPSASPSASASASP